MGHEREALDVIVGGVYMYTVCQLDYLLNRLSHSPFTGILSTREAMVWRYSPNSCLSLQKVTDNIETLTYSEYIVLAMYMFSPSFPFPHLSKVSPSLLLFLLSTLPSSSVYILCICFKVLLV